MILLGIIGPWQLLLGVLFVVGIPTIFYILGYKAGKKAGYLKRVRETDQINQ